MARHPRRCTALRKGNSRGSCQLVLQLKGSAMLPDAALTFGLWCVRPSALQCKFMLSVHHAGAQSLQGRVFKTSICLGNFLPGYI